MTKKTKIKGYKAFNQDWTCRDKKYACPGKFKEKGDPVMCEHGIHFCKKLMDCFEYYSFDESTKIAEVVAYGKTIEEGNKCCTNEIKIIREVPWTEVYDAMNIGKKNHGLWNIGYNNYGDRNIGNANFGRCNIGDNNYGNDNTGSDNYGNDNTGCFNHGVRNTGSDNKGRDNSGQHNQGQCNSGDWNKTDRSSGVFNTEPTTIYMFNKPSPWTYNDWMSSEAQFLLDTLSVQKICWIPITKMSDKEITEHPEAVTTGGYLKIEDAAKYNQEKWDNMLTKEQKQIIMDLPNFDPDIFKEITGVDVGKKKKKNQKKKK